MLGAVTQFLRSPAKLKELLREPRLVCGPIHPIMVLATGTVHTVQINVSLRGASIGIGDNSEMMSCNDRKFTPPSRHLPSFSPNPPPLSKNDTISAYPHHFVSFFVTKFVMLIVLQLKHQMTIAKLEWHIFPYCHHIIVNGHCSQRYESFSSFKYNQSSHSWPEARRWGHMKCIRQFLIIVMLFLV